MWKYTSCSDFGRHSEQCAGSRQWQGSAGTTNGTASDHEIHARFAHRSWQPPPRPYTPMCRQLPRVHGTVQLAHARRHPHDVPVDVSDTLFVNDLLCVADLVYDRDFVTVLDGDGSPEQSY